ncbi:MAG: hypothetical protein NVSMB52_07420 [Chloroflexota bacterium]
MRDNEKQSVESVTFSVQSLDDERGAMDLSNAINAVSGVARITVDLAGHTVSITFDADYADRESLRRYIQQTGYPIDA